MVDGGRHLYLVTEYASGGEVFGEFPFMYVAERSEVQVWYRDHVLVGVVECGPSLYTYVCTYGTCVCAALSVVLYNYCTVYVCMHVCTIQHCVYVVCYVRTDIQHIAYIYCLFYVHVRIIIVHNCTCIPEYTYLVPTYVSLYYYENRTKYTVKDMARLLPASSLHLHAAKVSCM